MTGAYIARRGRPAKHDFSAKLVEQFASKLSEEHFVVLTTAGIVGYKNVAADMNVPVGTIKSRMNRARAKMAALLEEDKHPNGAPKWAPDGTLLDENGNRSTFDEADQ